MSTNLVAPQPAPAPAPAPAPRGPVAEAPARFHDVEHGWVPRVEQQAPWIAELREAVQKQVSARSMCIAVTGGSGQERAQLVAQLGVSLSLTGTRTLLIDADFDRPELHQVLSLSVPSGAGFSQQLRRQKVGQPEPWVIVRCSPTLEALVEGRMRSPGMTASGPFEAAIRALRVNRHLLLIHAPTLDRPADLRPLAPLADAVIIARAGKPATLQLGSGALASPA